MKKGIDTRKMQEKNGHIFFATDIFIYVFMYKGFNYKGRRRERKQDRSFPFPFILRGKVHIYWFKPIPSQRGRELRDFDLWSSSLTTFLFVEGLPLHLESHLLNKIILSLPNQV